VVVEIEAFQLLVSIVRQALECLLYKLRCWVLLAFYALGQH
jgi:hypothetical protein